MTSIREAIRRFFSTAAPLPAGIYHSQSPAEETQNSRLHLRLEADGSGMLVINAATVLHLNQTAAEYAYHLVQQTPADEAATLVAERYRVKKTQATQDLQNVKDTIQSLLETQDLDPYTFLDVDRVTPFTTALSAPLRLDCALTYRLRDEHPGAAPLERVTRELDTAEWKKILDLAWQAGIFHVIFTGGEPTLRDDLAELIAHAEANGQVSGLLTDGAALANPAYLDQLLQTGLDHVMLNPDLSNEAAWHSIRQVIEADIFAVVHLTLKPETQTELSGQLEKLSTMGLKNVSLSANDPSLNNALKELSELAGRLGLNLIWDIPVPYSKNNPVSLEVQQDQLPEGAGRNWLYVEPDGDVLPGQGDTRKLGNLLKDEWLTIWSAPR